MPIFRHNLNQLLMRMLFISLLMMGLMAACQEKGAEVQAEFFGEEFAVATPVASGELASQMGENIELAKVQVSGEVLAACQMKGCWMKLPLPDGQEMRVTFKDYGFFVPKDCAGKQAVIQGKAYYDTTSVEDLRHYAVDGGMTEEEAAEKYTEPEVELSFEATGVALMEE